MICLDWQLPDIFRDSSSRTETLKSSDLSMFVPVLDGLGSSTMPMIGSSENEIISSVSRKKKKQRHPSY